MTRPVCTTCGMPCQGGQRPHPAREGEWLCTDVKACARAYNLARSWTGSGARGAAGHVRPTPRPAHPTRVMAATGDLRERPGDQPLPTPNDRPSIQSLVRADLDTREQLGIRRYGTSLQPFNGRDALRDLYEELLDATCYVRQVIEERPTDDAAVDGAPAGAEPGADQ